MNPDQRTSRAVWPDQREEKEVARDVHADRGTISNRVVVRPKVGDTVVRATSSRMGEREAGYPSPSRLSLR
jgi:hypothetical protein